MLQTVFLLLLLVYHVSDCAGQWQALQTGYGGTVTSVSFTSPDTGFIPAGNSIYKTVDGGGNWTRYAIEDGNTYELKSIHFPTPEVGYVAGETIYKTTNSGATWDSLHTLSDRNKGDLSVVKFIRFADELQGVIGLFGTPLYSQDGGSQWEMTGPVFETPSWNSDISFLGGGVAVIGGWNPSFAGDFGMVSRSTNNGETWSGIPDEQLYFESMQIHTVFFHDALHGWAGGSRMGSGRPYSKWRVMFTTNGGETWQSPSKILPKTVNCIQFANTQVGFVGDEDGGIYSTVDGGVSWSLENVETNGRAIEDICIVANSVYVVGASGLMLKSTIVTDVNEIPERSVFRIYPNPSLGRVHVVGSANHSDAHDGVVEVIDSFGRLVYSESMRYTAFTLDLGSLAKGMYFVRIRSGGHQRTMYLALI